MKITLEITGTAPLLMHNIRLANPLDPIAKEMKAISSKRKKTDKDLEDLAELEFRGGLYINDTGPFIPGLNVEKCLIEGARITKQGKQVERSLLITDLEVPLLYQGPRDLAGLTNDPSFRSVQAVRVGQSRIMRTRPIFNDWSLVAEGELDDTVLNLADFQSIASSSGRMVGLCDFRPRYGRFEVLVK